MQQRTKINTVALSGGVFLNALLTELSVDRLESAGFHVLTHHRVPPSDAGLALGQLVIGAGDLQAASSNLERRSTTCA